MHLQCVCVQYAYVYSVCVCMCTEGGIAHTTCSQRLEEGVGSLELELQTVVTTFCVLVSEPWSSARARAPNL